MRLLDMIFFWARTTPERAAILQSEMITTYLGLASAIESISRRIERLNLERSEPVAISIANPSFMIATAFGLFRSGYSVAIVNPTLFPYLGSAGIRNLVYDTHGQVLSGGRNIRFDMSWLPTKTSVIDANLHQGSGQEDVHSIFFTSGTTGLPKKIVQTGQALDQLLRYPFTCASGGQEKVLVLPGLSSTFGFNRVCELLNAGKTACLAPFGEPVLSMIDVFGIEFLVASSAQALTLAQMKQSNPSYRLETLRSVLIGGGKIGLEAIRSIRSNLCRNLLSQYGSTEAGVIALASFELIEEISGAVGFILPWTEIEIVDESGQVLPAGSEGVIRYRTPQFIENQKISQSESMPPYCKDSWFYPGDLGSIDPRGVLCLAGRSSDVINRGGHKVSGARIEEILENLPEIEEAGVCGVLGPSGLEELWVAIVAKEQIDVASLKQYLKEHNDVKIAPDELFFMDQLPRGELGKIQKGQLKEMLRVRKASQ